jgi:hypothetical protein
MSLNIINLHFIRFELNWNEGMRSPVPIESRAASLAPSDSRSAAHDSSSASLRKKDTAERIFQRFQDNRNYRLERFNKKVETQLPANLNYRINYGMSYKRHFEGNHKQDRPFVYEK